MKTGASFMTSLRNPFMAHADISKHLPSHKGRKVFNLSATKLTAMKPDIWAIIRHPQTIT